MCLLDEFACSSSPSNTTSSPCLPLRLRCNGVNDCADGSDEACGCADYCAGARRHLCADNVCVALEEEKEAECDGVRDCPDGSDEVGCAAVEESEESGAGEWHFLLVRLFKI